jgi:hypothetical protein
VGNDPQSLLIVELDQGIKRQNAALCDTYVKIGTDEGYYILINLRPRGILAGHASWYKMSKIQDGRQCTIEIYK